MYDDSVKKAAIYARMHFICIHASINIRWCTHKVVSIDVSSVDVSCAVLAERDCSMHVLCACMHACAC